ncbi:MAG: transporter substrate-binding domain-containing protein [Alteromonadaceae bacterium]|nr:transporter substrate-binding domain-containing protein [Alteromonadaceae bacterium]
MKVGFLVSFFAFFLTPSLASETLSSQVLKVVTTSYALYNVDTEGNLNGYSTQVVKALLRELNQEAQIEVLPWARAYNVGLTRPNTLIYSIAKTQARNDKFHWVGRILPMDSYLYQASNRTDLKIETFDDIGKLIVGGVNEGAPTQWLEQRKVNVLKMASNSRLNLQMLLKGRLDLIVMDPASLAIEMRQANIDKDAIKPVLYLPEPSYDLYLALSLGSSLELQKQVETAFENLRLSGQYDKIVSAFYKKYANFTLASEK